MTSWLNVEEENMKEDTKGKEEKWRESVYRGR